MENEILNKLRDEGYECALAYATKEEVEEGAACGQLAIVTIDD